MHRHAPMQYRPYPIEREPIAERTNLGSDKDSIVTCGNLNDSPEGGGESCISRFYVAKGKFFYRMPTISIYEDDVKAELGSILASYGSKQDLVKSFDELCFNFGLELDEVTSEYEMFKKERGMIKNAFYRMRI